MKTVFYNVNFPCDRRIKQTDQSYQFRLLRNRNFTLHRIRIIRFAVCIICGSVIESSSRMHDVVGQIF